MLKKKIIIVVFPLLLIFSDTFAQTKFVLPARQEILVLSEEIGLKEVGNTERNNRNDGEVRKYLDLFGLKEGNPYCAAGIYYTFYIAAQRLKYTTKEIPIPKTALANQIFNFGQINGQKVKFAAERNDLIVWRRAKTKFGHIERILRNEGKGWVSTLAFNVLDEKSGKEGVFLKRRNIYHPFGRLSIRGLIGFSQKISQK